MTAVRIEESENVVSIVLSRPETLNAMNTELIDGLMRALDDSRHAAALVLYGDGRAFCAGEDLRETLAPLTGTADELRLTLEHIQQITRTLTSMPIPVVVAVHGYAVGGGAELALSGDLIVMDPEAYMRFPEVTLGHAVTGAITTRLPAVVGLQRAKELLLTGRWISGSEAHAMGIANELSENPIDRALELANDLSAHSRRSLTATKLALELAAVPNQEVVLRGELDAAMHCFTAEDALLADRGRARISSAPRAASDGHGSAK